MSLTTATITTSQNFESFLACLNSNFEKIDEIHCTDAKIHFVVVSGGGLVFVFDKVVKFNEDKTLGGVYEIVVLELEHCREAINKVCADTYKFSLDLFLKDAYSKITWVEKRADYSREGEQPVPASLSTEPMSISMFQTHYEEAQKSHQQHIVPIIDSYGNFIHEGSLSNRLASVWTKRCLIL